MLIDALQAQNRIPDLTGVKIWIAGTGAGKSVPRSDSLRLIQSFWADYFKRTGAGFDTDRYGPALFNFAL